MLFSKLKSKEEELLPPPPPFPSMELEEEKETFSAEIKPKKAKTEVSKDKDFEELFKEVESLKPSREKIMPKKSIPQKPQKKIELKPVKKQVKLKQEKKLKLTAKKIAVPKVKEQLPLKKLKSEITTKQPKHSINPKEEKLEDIDFILPEDLEAEKEFQLPEELGIEKEIGHEKPEEINMPDNLEDLDIEKEFGELDFKGNQAKQREILEAEEEIKSAIEKIKQKEKPSLLNKIFGRREEKAEGEFVKLGDDVSAIHSGISKARDALMRFDLEAAKRNYIEIMKIYNKIKPEKQAKVYHDIRDLYFERKSAEELKV